MIEHIERMWRRVLLMIGRGRISFVDDSGAVQCLQARLSANAVQDDIPRLADYGFQSNPPPGADAALVFLAGNTSDALVIATGHQTFRLRNLKAGEVAISDDKGQRVFLSAAGIRIDGGGLPMQIVNAPSLLIDVPAVHMTGTLRVDGQVDGGASIVAALDVCDQGGTKSMSGMRGVYDGHTHVENGEPGSTNPPGAAM